MSSAISLTLGLAAIVDEEDKGLVAGREWHAHHCGGDQMRAACWEPGDHGQRHLVLMHRLILGAGASDEVDHVNGDTLDNRRCNLRLANDRQNARNRRIHKNNRCGLKGVRCVPDRPMPWRAAIRVDGHEIALGYFSDARQAARAYDQAARGYFGAFARTNQMMGLV